MMLRAKLENMREFKFSIGNSHRHFTWLYLLYSWRTNARWDRRGQKRPRWARSTNWHFSSYWHPKISRRMFGMSVFLLCTFVSGRLLNFFYGGSKLCTVRPRDTRPQAAQTLIMQVFEWGPKKFEMHEFISWKP